jgi:N-acetylglutamate synthase-like GNAT family acetyltransferase
VSGQVEIRRATTADASEIHELHTCSVKELCKDHYTPAQIDGWLKHRRPAGYLAGIERGEMFVAVAGSEIVGFGHAVPGEVIAVFVAPHRTGRGVGRSLLNYGMQLAQGNAEKTVHLEATLNAQEFYARAGFVPIKQQLVQRNDIFLPVVVMEWRSEI